MPVSSSAKKQIRVDERRRIRNKPIRSEVKTSITKAEKLIFSGELEAAREAVAAAISLLDKAVVKGILHDNNSARRKSRLMNKLNQALASTENEPTEAE